MEQLEHCESSGQGQGGIEAEFLQPYVPTGVRSDDDDDEV